VISKLPWQFDLSEFVKLLSMLTPMDVGKFGWSSSKISINGVFELI
jgi:hypothetical protein